MAEDLETTTDKRLAAIILSGFVLFALIVGGIGISYFRRQQTQNVAATNNADQAEQNTNGDLRAQDNRQPPRVAVDRLDNGSLPTFNEAVSDQNKLPKIVFEASSVRQPENNNFYFPNFAFDKNKATAWCEGANGAGAGEWLQFNFAREATLQKIEIQPGYFKNAQTWRDNNRVAAITLGFSNGETRKFTLADEMNTQTLDVGRIQTKYVRITIEKVYEGDRDREDTFISDVLFVAEP